MLSFCVEMPEARQLCARAMPAVRLASSRAEERGCFKKSAFLSLKGSVWQGWQKPFKLCLRFPGLSVPYKPKQKPTAFLSVRVLPQIPGNQAKAPPVPLRERVCWLRGLWALISLALYFVTLHLPLLLVSLLLEARTFSCRKEVRVPRRVS